MPTAEAVAVVVEHLRGHSRAIQTVLGHFTARNVRRHSSDLANVVVFLRPIQYRSAEGKARLLGRNFQEWTTLMNPQPHAPDVEVGLIGTSTV